MSHCKLQETCVIFPHSIHFSLRIAVTELISSFNLLHKTLQSLEMSDSNLEPLTSSSNEETGSLNADKDMQSDALNTEGSTPVPIPVQVQSSHELESIIIFDLCALSEIATTKSAVLRVREGTHFSNLKLSF